MSFDAWIAHRDGERVREVKLVCTECGGPAEGNCSWTDGSGEICDNCVEQDEVAAQRDRDEAADQAYHYPAKASDTLEPPPGSWASVARIMAQGDDSGFDWDDWKDRMKDGMD